MVRIESIEVTNYKNLGHINLPLEPFNVIVGANNAGKSNFVQILSFLDYVVNRASDEVEFCFDSGFFPSPFQVVFPKQITPNKSRGIIQQFNIKFKDTIHDKIYTYELEIEWLGRIKGKINTEILTKKDASTTGKAPIVFKRIGNKIDLGSEIKDEVGSSIKSVSNYSSVIKFLKFVSLDSKESNLKQTLDAFDQVLKAPILYFSNIELNKAKHENRLDEYNGRIISINVQNEIAALKDTKHWKIFEEVVKDILGVTNIQIVPISARSESTIKEYAIICTHQKTHKLITELSDGSLNVLALLVKILNSKDDIIIIEEPENSLHPKALQLLVQFMRHFEDEKQFIITTHSIALINFITAKDVVIARCKEDGFSELVRVSDQKDLVKQLKKGYDSFSDLLFFNTGDSEIEMTSYGEE